MPATVTVETLDALSPRDLPQLDALVAASGWNQLVADWRLFERLGSVHAIRDGEGNIVASGAVLPLERAADAPRNQPGAAWISMILVAPAARGQASSLERSLKQRSTSYSSWVDTGECAW